MSKRSHENTKRWQSVLILLTVSGACLGAYLCISPHLDNPSSSPSQESSAHVAKIAVDEDGAPGCCKGLENTELWSEAVNRGNDFLLDSTRACCGACKANPRCNSWVYCADQAKCGSNYRQCWLKRQKDPLSPEFLDSGISNPWTSGLVFNKDVGIVGLVIDNGIISREVIRMQLLPDCAPKSVMQILELVKLTYCSGCRFYRADGRAKLWDSHGSHVPKMTTGPPYAVVQGTLKALHVPFKGIPKEHTPAIRRGMVGWVGEGPDFFISLADHYEWPRKHTVFATILEDDMDLVESLSELPTTTTFWGSPSERVAIEELDTHINLKVQRATK